METIKIKSLSGSVIFEHTAEDNTITLTVEEAVNKNVKLNRANLANANLAGANLRNTSLKDADLSWADLIGADLEDADLEDADLSWADLENANLKNAKFKDANLKGAILKGAFLAGAHLNAAHLNGAHLNGAQNIPYIPLACPSEGAFVAWKKVDGKYLVKLQIPEDARRSSATTRKCRCDKAMVLDITSLDGNKHYDEVTNNNYKETVYKVGEMVYPDSFDENRWNECSNGIHFFINKEDAINY